MGIGPDVYPLICTDDVALAYRFFMPVMTHLLIAYFSRIAKRNLCEILSKASLKSRKSTQRGGRCYLCLRYGLTDGGHRVEDVVPRNPTKLALAQLFYHRVYTVCYDSRQDLVICIQECDGPISFWSWCSIWLG